ncbi:MAG: LEA type 2 family protein [Bacteroidota bacterium]|nr:LEA type 2 family protein [Bacteroidota bacterium]
MASPLHVISARVWLLSAALAAGVLASCSVSDQTQDSAKYPSTDALKPAPPAPNLRQERKAVRTYAKTTISLAGLDEAQLGGFNVLTQNAGPVLAPAQADQLAAAASSNANVPLRLRLRLEARNPNRQQVLLNELEYQVLVDNREVARGTTDDVLEVPGRKTLSIPLTVTANVHDVLDAGMKPERLASAFGTWNRQPARLSVRVRPTFQNATGRAFRPTGFEPIQALVYLQ